MVFIVFDLYTKMKENKNYMEKRKIQKLALSRISKPRLLFSPFMRSKKIKATRRRRRSKNTLKHGPNTTIPIILYIYYHGVLMIVSFVLFFVFFVCLCVVFAIKVSVRQARNYICQTTNICSVFNKSFSIRRTNHFAKK